MVPTGATRRVATVFGGSGFIGRYIVKRLAQRGYVVRVAVRDPEAALFLKPMGAVGQVVPLYARSRTMARLRAPSQDADLVVNLVGILVENRKRRFPAHPRRGRGADRAVRSAAGAASGWCMCRRSAPIPTSPSLYGASKGRGEAAVRAAFPRATILRPSIVFGPEDKFFNRFGMMAQVAPSCRSWPARRASSRSMSATWRMRCSRRRNGWTRPGRDLRAGRPARVDLPRNPCLHPRGDASAPSAWSNIPPGLARLQASVLEVLPGKPLTRDQLLNAASATMSCRPGCRGWPNWASCRPRSSSWCRAICAGFGPAANARTMNRKSRLGPDRT